jgi:hypothetical protein
MSALKRKQNWPLGVEKGARILMQTKSGQLQMLGYCVGEYFYTPDIGKDKWEVWSLSDLSSVSSCKSA